MTVRELIAELQEQDPDAKVYRSDAEWGPEPVFAVSSDVKVKTLYKTETVMVNVTAWKDGQEIIVQIPEQKHVATGYMTGVLIQ